MHQAGTVMQPVNMMQQHGNSPLLASNSGRLQSSWNNPNLSRTGVGGTYNQLGTQSQLNPNMMGRHLHGNR